MCQPPNHEPRHRRVAGSFTRRAEPLAALRHAPVVGVGAKVRSAATRRQGRAPWRHEPWSLDREPFRVHENVAAAVNLLAPVAKPPRSPPAPVVFADWLATIQALGSGPVRASS